ncbi:MAG: FAD-dependent oxidoreductase [Verrucomicrobium sp.]|nr:FAD-dependent oxidoreductase [Verrucomicrobium sp.]
MTTSTQKWHRFTRPVFLALLAITWRMPLLAAPNHQQVEADLLIVGGNESGCAAAVQAARLGVKNIVLVTDIEWLGGQFSAEGVGCLDEWTMVQGKRVNFPRSGLFKEVVDRMRAYNSGRYGYPSPGNAWCGTETIEPAAAAKIFEELLAPYTDKAGGSGQIRILRQWQPNKVEVAEGAVKAVRFEPTQADAAAKERPTLTVGARITLDSSDWGDVIRLSGARYGAGPDLKSRFGEPSAPENLPDGGRQEMNPISWCVVLRETGGRAAIIPPPPSYDARSFASLDKTPPWVDSDMSAGIYNTPGWSIYTHRRLVDRWHLKLAPGTEATFLNWPVQDYPLVQLPQRVIDALEATEPGAARKNIVDMTPTQRRIVFADARQHALGMLHHLQTRVHDRVGDFPQSFRYMELTPEFGTADQLPPKPYVREGLRLEAVTMLREQDIRARDRNPRWAKTMVPDGVFGFQFNIDFHPTQRKYLTEDRNGPWQFIHTPNRGWHTDTDRAMFPLRGLVPVELNGLLGCSKNIGVSSVVQSALRLHGQMMHVGQASATLAWLALREGVAPRTLATDPAKWLEIQQRLLRGCGGPGVLIWPWQDVAPDDTHFEAANLLAVQGVWQADPEDVSFRPAQTVTRRELAGTLVRLCDAMPGGRTKPDAARLAAVPRFTDVAELDPGRAEIETLIARGDFGKQQPTFTPEGAVTWGSFHRWLKAMGLPAHAGLLAKDSVDLPLTRAECVRHLWSIRQGNGV